MILADNLQLLRDSAWQGSQRAAEALGKFSGSSLIVHHVNASIISVEELSEMHGDPEGIVAGIHFSITGDLHGSILAFFQLTDARMLVEALTGTLPISLDDFGDMALSALAEAGNIVVSSFLSAHEALCGLIVMPSPPTIVIEMCAAVLTSAVLPYVEAGGGILVLEAEISSSSLNTSPAAACRLILLPTSESWSRLSQALAQQQ